MKRSIPALLLILFLFSSSCKKAIQQKQQDIIMSAITDGIWLVEKYQEGATDISSDFAGYEFKFLSNGTVTGTLSGNATSGNWSGDAANYTITSNFPTAGDPVKKLNAVWKITDSYWDFVVAETTTANGKNILNLRKK